MPFSHLCCIVLLRQNNYNTDSFTFKKISSVIRFTSHFGVKRITDLKCINNRFRRFQVGSGSRKKLFKNIFNEFKTKNINILIKIT